MKYMKMLFRCFACPRCKKYMAAYWKEESETYFGKCEKCGTYYEATDTKDGKLILYVRREIN